MTAQQTAQGVRHSPEGSLWHFSAKSKDGKKERISGGQKYIRVSKKKLQEIWEIENV